MAENRDRCPTVRREGDLGPPTKLIAQQIRPCRASTGAA